MATPDEQLALVGGHLILNPASATPGAGGNYGGTILGTIQDLVVTQDVRADLVTAEEYGSEEVDGVFLGETWRCAAALGNLDADGIAQAYYETTAGSGAVRYMAYPHSSYKAGGLLTTKRIGLLLAPYDAATKPGFRFFGAVLLPERSREFRYGSFNELRFQLAWLGLRDDSGRTIRKGLVADLMA